MSLSHILFEAGSDGVATIAINRPDSRNSLNRATILELDQAFARVQNEPGLRGLILTGAGDRAFVAGADVRELAATTGPDAESLSVKGQNVFRRLETMRKPSVAAINGYALGGGLELAMCCTVRIASSDALLGQPEVKLGVPPGYGATQRLPRLVGRGRALDMLLSAEPITAAEAWRIGLVNHVVEKNELLPFSRAWLAKVLAHGPLALGFTMDAVDTGYESGFSAGLRFEAMAFGLAAASSDRVEGTRAFLEKRTPVFTGK